MPTILAILVSIGLFVASYIASVVLGFNASIPMVLVTTTWAAVDSSKIGLRNYESGISFAPVPLFFAIGLLWIVGFPWYLSIRHKIKTGTAILKPEPNAAQPG